MYKFLLTCALCLCTWGILLASPPKAIYIDFGGVIAEPDREEQVQYLVETLGFPRESVENSRFLNWMQLHPKELAFLEQIANEHHLVLTQEALAGYRQCKRNSVHEIPGIRSLVHTLREHNYKVYLITNIQPENLDILQPFTNMFEDLIHCPTSSGKRQEAWMQEASLHNLPLSECLLIDDQLPNVLEAETLGMQTILFQTKELLQDELIRKGILSPSEEKETGA